MSESSPQREFERILEFQRSMRQRMSTRTIPFAWGTAYLQDTYPIVWDLNLLSVERVDDDLSAGVLLDEADRILGSAGLAHRKVNVMDAAAGASLAEDFRQAGWGIVQIVTMVLRSSTEKDTAIEVQELDDAGYRQARRVFLQREPYGSKKENVRQLVDKVDAIKEATRFRAFGVPVGKQIAAICELYTDGAIAQIEDVGTLVEHRGRGYAAAVVLRAVDEAVAGGCELVFLNADAADWPKEMYARLGFEPIGNFYEFTKTPDGVS